jgi:hypothetical protein
MLRSREGSFRPAMTFWVAGTLIVLFQLTGWVQTAHGIPAYARKYGTSCQTCHIAFPKLNAYGQAFRLLGYRLPDETEDLIKQPDVKLGAEAYKRVWPDAVWPGAIPSQAPFAVVAEFLVRNASALEEEDGETDREVVHNDFLFPSEVALVFGGTAGDHVAYFGEIEFEQEAEHEGIVQDVSIGHFDIRFTRLVGGTPALNVKIGSFQPELVSTFDHARRLTVANYDAMFSVGTSSPGGAAEVGGEGHHGGGSGIALPAVSRGLELYGILAHRLLWSAAAVNGLGPGHETFDGNSRKDLYGRVAYKLGGMAPDGSNAASYTSNPKNWQERSVQVGLIGLLGDGEDVHFEGVEDTTAIEFRDEDYSRYGADFNVFFGDLNLFGAFIRGKDDIQVEMDPDESGEFTYNAWFAEADGVLHYPWLHGALRYEGVDLPHEGLENWERGTVSMTALVRANVKTVLEYTRDLNEAKNYEVWAGAAIAF